MPVDLQETPSADELAGIVWWNRLDEARRLEWCRLARSAVPASAWIARKLVAHALRLAELARLSNTDAYSQLRLMGEVAVLAGGTEALERLRLAILSSAHYGYQDEGLWLVELLARAWDHIPASGTYPFPIV